jgi:hypothetical protein
MKGFPEFEQFYCLGFPKSTQTSKSLASTSFATPALANNQILSALSGEMELVWSLAKTLPTFK